MSINWLVSVFVALFFIVHSAAFGDPIPVTICRPNNLIGTFLYVADQKGFFKEEGLNPKFETASNAKICNDLLISGHAEMSVGAEGPFAYTAQNNPPLKIAATLGRFPEQALVVRRDRGISSERDLAGRSIGYLPGTVSFIYLAHVLERAGIPFDKVKLVPLQPAAMPLALQSGIVDVISIWQPWVAQGVERAGGNALVLCDPDLYSYLAIFLVTDEFRRSKPQAIKAVLRAFLKAEKFLAENSSEAIPMLSKAVAFDQKLLEQSWTTYTHQISEPQKVLPVLEQDFKFIKRHDANFKDVAVPDFGSFVDDSFYKEIVKSKR